MNSLGAGGAEKPYLVNAANALTFCLMVVTCFFGSAVVRLVGIKWTLVIGTMGYAPYAAGLYTNNRFGTEWFVLLGAALCGLSAGLFWMAEGAIALSYPEPHNQGRFLGFWLSFRVGGQILGGAINLGINANRSTAGSVSYTVYLVFIALQALGPFAALLLNKPSRVQRTDGLPVRLGISHSPLYELKAMAKLFIRRDFLLIVPLIVQAVFTEAVMFTFLSLWFSVRARALGSFLSGIIALIVGNLLGAFLDSRKLSLRSRSRGAFFVVLGLQGAWWVWATVIVTEYHRTLPSYDWADAGFGRGFALYLFWVAGFQLNYMYLYVSCLGLGLWVCAHKLGSLSSAIWRRVKKRLSGWPVSYVGQSQPRRLYRYATSPDGTMLLLTPVVWPGQCQDHELCGQHLPELRFVGHRSATCVACDQGDWSVSGG